MKFRSVFMALSCAFALAACGGQDGSASVQAGSPAAEVPAGSVKVQTAHGEAVVPQYLGGSQVDGLRLRQRAE